MPAAPSSFRSARKLITIGITPPEEASHTPAARLIERNKNKNTRPTPDVLAAQPWLQQNGAYQAGAFLMTHGLTEKAGHMELEVCNVPLVFVVAAAEMLNDLADMVLNGSVFKHGECCQLDGNRVGPAIVGFRQIEPGSDPYLPHALPVLRVVFLR